MKLHTRDINKSIPTNTVILEFGKSFAFMFALKGKWYFNSTMHDGSDDFFEKLIYSIKQQIKLIKHAEEWKKENTNDLNGLERERGETNKK